MGTKVLMIGIEGVDASFFMNNSDEFPHMRKLLHSGRYLHSRRTDPPSSTALWSAIVNGKKPSEAGLYDTYQRRNYSSYTENAVPDCVPRGVTIEEILSQRGYESIVVASTPNYLPKKPRNCPISYIFIPDQESIHIHPEELREELINSTDIFSLEEASDVSTIIDSMTKKRFSIARYLLMTRPWDFFMFSEPRMKYPPCTHEDKGDTRTLYYKQIDEEIGSLLGVITPDTHVILILDHEIKKAKGAFYLNEWLLQEGYLKIKPSRESIGEKELTSDMIDWSGTQAWGKGGDFGSIWLNVRGRESQGIIPAEKFEHVQNILIHKLVSLSDEKGNPLYTKVVNFSKSKNVSPDLLLYFFNSQRKPFSTVGLKKIFSRDVCEYIYEDIFIFLRGFDKCNEERLSGFKITDIAPLILQQFPIVPL